MTHYGARPAIHALRYISVLLTLTFTSTLHAELGKQALLPGTEHDQLLEVLKGALSDSLTAQLDPHFQQLFTRVQTALQQSVQAVREPAAVENAIVATHLELISHHVRGLQESIDNPLHGLQASCDKNAKELRRLTTAG